MVTHHAVCYIGIESGRAALSELFASSDPDIHIINNDEFKIDDARELTRQASMTPVAASQQIFVVTANGITVEAQNALLKLVEEPPERSQFYLIVPKLGILLPTLQSRLHFEAEDKTLTSQNTEVFNDFLKSEYGVRLNLVATISKDKDKESIEAIVAGVERHASAHKDIALLKSVSFVREHIGNRGASSKMLLEALALALPQK